MHPLYVLNVSFPLTDFDNFCSSEPKFIADVKVWEMTLHYQI
jgi:hypothetical protein